MMRNIVILTGAGVSAESGLATFRGPDGLWEGHRVEDVATPEAFRARSGAGPCLLRCAAGEARNRRAQCRAPRAGAARCRMAGRAAAGHAECRRFARARRVEAAAPHAWRADQRLVPGVRRALRLDGADGRGRRCPSCGDARAGPARTSSGSARCRTRWSGSTRRCSAATCSCRSGRRARSIPPRGSSRPRAIAARRRWRSTSSRALAAIMFDESRTGRAGELVPAWVEEVLGAQSAHSSPISR